MNSNEILPKDKNDTFDETNKAERNDTSFIIVKNSLIEEQLTLFGTSVI